MLSLFWLDFIFVMWNTWSTIIHSKDKYLLLTDILFLHKGYLCSILTNNWSTIRCKCTLFWSGTCKCNEMIWFIVFNATFSNISAISWRPVLVVEEARVPGENHWPWASNWKTLSLAAASRVHLFCILQSWERTHTVLVIGKCNECFLHNM